MKPSAEPDVRRRGDHGAPALIFAEAVDRPAAWKQALHGWNMTQSQQVLEWKAEGKADTLLRILDFRFGSLPADLVTAIRSVTDLSRLDQCVDAALGSADLDDFRRAAGL